MKSNAVCYQLKSSLTSLAFEWKQIESDKWKRYSCRRQFHYLTSFSDHNKLLIEGYEKNMKLCDGLIWKRNLAVTNETPFCAEMESVLPRLCLQL